MCPLGQNANFRGVNMGIVNMVQTIKEIHKLDIVFVKIGNFYHVYGKDSYIISYLFEYKLKKVEMVSALKEED